VECPTSPRPLTHPAKKTLARQNMDWSESMPNFTRLDPARPDVSILINAMLRAREVVATRSWSSSQEPITEAWWADVLADPRSRILRESAMAAGDNLWLASGEDAMTVVLHDVLPSCCSPA
jgi:hypothetical protein